MNKLLLFIGILISTNFVSCCDDDDSVDIDCVNDFLNRYGFTAHQDNQSNGCFDFLALYEYAGAQYFSWGNPCVDFAGPIVFDCNGNELCQIGTDCDACQDLCFRIIEDGDYKGNVGFKFDYVDIHSMLNGDWELNRITGGIAGSDDHYSSGEVSWTFDLANSKLLVDNNYSGSNLSQGGFPTDTFDMQIVGNVLGTQKLLIEGLEIGELTIESNRLEIAAGCCDLYNYSLTKIE